MIPCKFIFGLGNKIVTKKYIEDIGITFNVSTNEKHEFKNNVFGVYNNFGIYSFKYTLISP